MLGHLLRGMTNTLKLEYFIDPNDHIIRIMVAVGLLPFMLRKEINDIKIAAQIISFCFYGQIVLFVLQIIFFKGLHLSHHDKEKSM
jgi:hypothetical protein